MFMMQLCAELVFLLVRSAAECVKKIQYKFIVTYLYVLTKVNIAMVGYQLLCIDMSWYGPGRFLVRICGQYVRFTFRFTFLVHYLNQTRGPNLICGNNTIACVLNAEAFLFIYYCIS